MSEFEDRLQIEQVAKYSRLVELFGDRDKWEWRVNVVYACRAERLDTGILGSQLKADLRIGTKKCPMRGVRKRNLVVPHPAFNTVQPVAVHDLPEKCPLCGLAPITGDFEEFIE